MEPMKWEKFEEYKAQGENQGKVLERFYKGIEEARRDIQANKAAYDELIVREVAEGVDLSKEKKATKQAEIEAEKALEYAREDLARASQVRGELFDGITQDDLFDDWNNIFVPKVKKEVIEPVEEYFRQARATYLDALLKAHEVHQVYGGVWDKHNNGVLKNMRRNNASVLPRPIFDFYQLPRIKEKDQEYVRKKKKLPKKDAKVLAHTGGVK
ncbi:hypothetical protein [Priestia megaterium]|uniref:hypothetical protein n=1 Tax=Priestia megaterium TaxID=1404 RepID=UPI001A94E129|nr:hypothetical protein [Priestia megaterium]QSX18458.1 hypothetical protein J0P05_14335 [Priestia megaterium]